MAATLEGLVKRAEARVGSVLREKCSSSHSSSTETQLACGPERSHSVILARPSGLCRAAPSARARWTTTPARWRPSGRCTRHAACARRLPKARAIASARRLSRGAVVKGHLAHVRASGDPGLERDRPPAALQPVDGRAAVLALADVSTILVLHCSFPFDLFVADMILLTLLTVPPRT